MPTPPQLDLFAASHAPPATAVELREIERYGKMDFLTLLPLRNGYSSKLDAERWTAYEQGYLRAASSG